MVYAGQQNVQVARALEHVEGWCRAVPMKPTLQRFPVGAIVGRAHGRVVHVEQEDHVWPNNAAFLPESIEGIDPCPPVSMGDFCVAREV